jgi:hypothetical protein
MPQRVAAEVNAENLIKAADLGEGADAVIDASGAEPSIQTSIHVVRRGGVYVQGGMGKPDITFPIMALCTKEITMRGSFRYGSGDYKLAVQLVASGSLDVKSLVSREVPFKDAEQAFEDVLKGRGIKVLIRGPNHEGDAKAEAKGEEKKEVEAPAAAAVAEEAVAEKSEEVAAAPEAEKTETETTAPVEAAAPVEETTKSVATETEPVVEAAKADEATETSEPVVDIAKAEETTEAAAAPAAEESAPAVVEEKTEEAPEVTESAPVTEESAPVSTEAAADAEAAKPEETAEPAAPVEIPERTSVLDTIRKIEETAKKTDALG